MSECSIFRPASESTRNENVCDAWPRSYPPTISASARSVISRTRMPALRPSASRRAIAVRARFQGLVGAAEHPRVCRTARRLGLRYVLQVAANRRVPTHAGPIRVDQLPVTLPARAWQKLPAGAGSKGERLYSWAWIALQPELSSDDATDPATTCSSAATTAPASWPTHAATAPAGCLCGPWSAWPGNAGGSREPSRLPRGPARRA